MRVSHWSPAATSGVDRSGALNDFGVAIAMGIFGIASGQALAADVELLMDSPVLIVVVCLALGLCSRQRRGLATSGKRARLATMRIGVGVGCLRDQLRDMHTALLATKLHVPPYDQAMVLRHRPSATLSKALSSSPAPVSAPARYGKATPVSSWLRETRTLAARLSLDESDGERPLERFGSRSPSTSP